MGKNVLGQFPDMSRIWIYGFKNELSEKKLQIVHSTLQSFVDKWKSHGRDVEGDYLILERRFLVLAVSEKDTVSGCSIDSSVRMLTELRDSFGFDALDQNIVFFKQNDHIQTAGRIQFMEMVSSGKIHEEALVYDLSIQNLGSLRRGEFSKKFRDSWAAAAFPYSN